MNSVQLLVLIMGMVNQAKNCIDKNK